MSLFKVGDKVGTMWGDGVVVEIVDGSVTHPVVVDVENVTYGMEFSEDGLYGGEYGGEYEKHPSIWHKETGSAPVVGKRPFEYPIYKRAKKTGLVVKFTGLCEGEVVVEARASSADSKCPVGHKVSDWAEHTDDWWWEDCDAPRFEPSEPTWCWVQREKRLVVSFEDGVYKYVCNVVGGVGYSDTATPCEDKDVPTWWKELNNGKA